MDCELLEYLRSLKPEKHPNGMELVKKGIQTGNQFEAGRSVFVRESRRKYSCYLDYKKECMREGKIIWLLLVGLATLEEQVDAIIKINQFSKRTGLEINLVQCIPSCLIALPKEYRVNVPATTSYMMDSLEDYLAQTEAAPMNLIFGDHHLVTPNAIETTINALKCGSPRIGVFSQFLWGHPGFDDDLKRYGDMVTALGIMASKRDEMFTVETYLDDGFPGYFIDCTSFVGYALLEHYICTTLCGARYSISFGGLLSEIDTRMAIAMALHALLSTEEQPVMSYINSSTNMQWDHDIHANYGTSCQEFLFEILVEKRYKMGLGINPVAITEKIAVPTLQELLNIFVAGKRTEEKADDWLPFMDFSKLEKMRDVMMREGRIFFENVLKGFRKAGIDVEDPLEMVLTLKKFNPVEFEKMFHSTSAGKSNAELKPFYPTVLGRQTVQMKEAIIEELKAAGLEGGLRNKRIIVASGDAHTYGLILVDGVLTAMGASVVSGGVDMDAVDVLDLADEEGSPYVGVSCHNGQALDYGSQLLQLAKERDKKYFFFMGGKLNAILPGCSEPVEIDHMLKEIGILATNDLRETVEKIMNWN